MSHASHLRRALLGVLPLVMVVALANRAIDPPLTSLREIPSPAMPGSAEANLAVGPSGRVYLSWIDVLPDSSHALRFSVLGGSSWSTPRTIASGRGWFVNWADFPSLLALDDRTLAAHWLVKRGRGWEDYDVHIARSRDGGATWGAPVIPHRDGTESEHGFVSMWAGSRGTVGVVWLDGRKYAAAAAARARGDSTLVRQMTLRAATIGADGALSGDVELDGRACDCCQTAAAVTADGPMVVYRDRSEHETRDIYVVRLVNGSWTAPQPVAEDGWEINACPVNGPAVAAAGRRAAVAWFTAARQTKRVRLAFSTDAGATFGSPIEVDDGRPVGRVGIVMLDDGAAIVSWLEEVGRGAEVRVRRIEADGSRGPSMTVASSSAARPSGFPRMARAGDRVVFAWRDPEGGGVAQVHTATARLPGPSR